MPEAKLDLKKLHKSYYFAKTVPEFVEFTPAQYVSITGQGEPAGILFIEATELLYTVAYCLKALEKADGHDFGIPNLEGLWSADGS